MRGEKFHFAKLENSPRLQRLLAFLQERGDRGATTRDICIQKEIMAASTAVDELRMNGFNILASPERSIDSASRIHRYFLIPN